MGLVVGVNELRQLRFTYFIRFFLTYFLYELTALNIVSPIWIALIVAFPTFGYLYLQCARITDSIVYAKVMYEMFGWDSKKYYRSWLGILLTPTLTAIGYIIGVLLAIRDPFVLMVLTITTCSYFVYRFVK